METSLTLGVGGFPPFSARGCVQQLFSVEQGEWFRTLNGTLLNTTQNPIKKYRTHIRCSDYAPPVTDQLIPGTEIFVGCIQRLWQAWDGTSHVILDKDPVPGSIASMATDTGLVAIQSQQGRHVSLESREGGGWISYRPCLRMQLRLYRLTTQEWDGSVAWEMELDEV
jgi:hypothetical protein